MDTTFKTTLDPKILGFWTRCMRKTSHLSQDALAEASGLDVRTIQRIESGHSISLTTRRCLARGLGYDDQDKFDNLEFIETVTRLLGDLADQQLNEQHPDCVRVKATRVGSGDALGRFAETSNAMMLTADDNIFPHARATAAALFDFIRDMMDLGETSYANRLSFHESLEALRKELEEDGTAVFTAHRAVKIGNDTWRDPTPMSFTVGYLVVVPKGKEVEELMVPKRFQFG